MLTSLLVAYLLLGGSSVVVGTLATGESVDAMKSAIHRTVKDSARERAATKIVDSWQDAGKKYLEAGNADHKAILSLVQRHDASRAEFDAVNRRIDQRDAQTLKQFTATREALRQQITREEWPAIFMEVKKR